jgi:hypothetical protein
MGPSGSVGFAEPASLVGAAGAAPADDASHRPIELTFTPTIFTRSEVAPESNRQPGARTTVTPSPALIANLSALPVGPAVAAPDVFGFLSAAIGVFVSNGDEPGENGGLLIGNGANGAPGQNGGRAACCSATAATAERAWT